MVSIVIKTGVKKVGTASQTVIADHYARGLYAAAMDHQDASNNLAHAAQDLRQLAHIIDTNADLSSFLSNPLAKAHHGDVLNNIATELQFSTTVQSFLHIVASQGRTASLALIARRFDDMMTANSDQATAHVKVATPMTASQEKELQILLQKKFNKTITLDIHEDASLLGGMTVFVGSQMIDDSMRSKLEQFRLYMKGQ